MILCYLTVLLVMRYYVTRSFCVTRLIRLNVNTGIHLNYLTYKSALDHKVFGDEGGLCTGSVVQSYPTLCACGLYPPCSTMLPHAWNFPGKNTGAGCHFLLQGIFLTQGSNPHLLHTLYWQVDSLPLSHLGSPLGGLLSDVYHLDFSSQGPKLRKHLVFDRE